MTGSIPSSPIPEDRTTGDLARVLAKHQLADVLPFGVLCTCGAELAALNPPLDDGAIKGEPLALAVHQVQEMEPALRAKIEALGWTWHFRGPGDPGIEVVSRSAVLAALGNGGQS